MASHHAGFTGRTSADCRSPYASAQGHPLIGMLFLAGSFLAATHDIAIDGYYLETLDTRQQARFIGYRVMTYRIAMMAGAGVIATIGTTKGWTMAFGGSALILALFAVYHLRYLPQSETARLPLTILLPKPATGRLLRLACAAALALIAVRLYDQTILAQGLLLLQLFLHKINLAGLIGMRLAGGLIIIGVQRE